MLPKPMPFYARAFFCIVALCAFWVLLNQVEEYRNPQGFDLGMQYQIQENAELSKQSFEVWKEEK